MMVPVTQDVFFKKIEKLDVHPSIVSKWDEDTGYKCEWKQRDGSVIGESTSGNGIGQGKTYLLKRHMLK